MQDIATDTLTNIEGGNFWKAFECGLGIVVLGAAAAGAPATAGLSMLEVGLIFAATEAACSTM